MVEFSDNEIQISTKTSERNPFLLLTKHSFSLSHTLSAINYNLAFVLRSGFNPFICISYLRFSRLLYIHNYLVAIVFILYMFVLLLLALLTVVNDALKWTLTLVNNWIFTPKAQMLILCQFWEASNENAAIRNVNLEIPNYQYDANSTFSNQRIHTTSYFCSK